MNIWAFPSFYPYNVPGLEYAGIFAHRQYKGLVANGAQLKVIEPIPWAPMYPFSRLHKDWEKYRNLDYPKHRVYDGVSVYHPRIANMKPNRFVKKSFDERYVGAITDFFRKNRIALHRSNDIFYSQWLPYSMWVQEAAHRLGVKSAVLSIGDDVVLWPDKSKLAFGQFRKTLEEADVRLACADYLGKLANEKLGENLSYTTVRMGAEHQIFKPATADEKIKIRTRFGLPADKLVILMIGTAVRRKGWIDFFEALKIVRAEIDNFVVAGIHTGAPDFDFKYETELRGLGEIFFDLPTLSPDSLPEVYKTADIFCLPSHSEGIANVVIEAMASGIATITTNICGHPELVTDGVNGFLVPPQNTAALSEKILLLLKDAACRARVGSMARDFIVNEWGDYQFNALKLLNILEATLSL